MRRPAESFPLGTFIDEELPARGWDRQKLADISGLTIAEVNAIMDEPTRRIGIQEAVGLQHAFGASAAVWINLNRSYREWAKSEHPKEANSMGEYPKVTCDGEGRVWVILWKSEPSSAISRDDAHLLSERLCVVLGLRVMTGAERRKLAAWETVCTHSLAVWILPLGGSRCAEAGGKNWQVGVTPENAVNAWLVANGHDPLPAEDAELLPEPAATPKPQ